MGSANLLAFFGHHKAATSWIGNIVQDACNTIGLKYVAVSNARLFDHDLDRFVQQQGIDFLSYKNAKFEYVQQLSKFRGFHVVRDPRDITVSAYFSHLKTHSTKQWTELVDYREKLQNLPKEEGLLAEIHFREKSFTDMITWDYTLPHVLELRMEDVTQQPETAFEKIFAHLGLLGEQPASDLSAKTRKALHHVPVVGRSMKQLLPPQTLSHAQLTNVLDKHSFAAKTGGRKPGEENVNSHYRKGTPGDWRNHFTDEHIRVFKEKYGDLLVRLGYEKSLDW